MDVQIKRMNWFQKPPLHEQMAAWREKQRAATEQFEQATAAAASTFASAQTDLFTGLAELTAQAVIDRTQAQVDAATQAFADEVNDSLDDSESSGTVLDLLA